jgi:diacylglycerol kinase (ATP)
VTSPEPASADPAALPVVGTGEVAVLANPAAGRGRHRDRLAAILDRLRESGRQVRLLDAGDPVEAEAVARAAVAGGAGALVAVGGDGTVHLALQAVAGTGVPLGIVPAGTGNDFAVEVGVRADPLTAAASVARALRVGGTRKVDLAEAHGPGGFRRWFGAVLGAGFDAIVNERANGMRWPRGPVRYDLAILLELARLTPRRYTLTVDGEAHEIDSVLLAIGNTASYGGGMRICPAADPADGLLDVVYAGRLSRLALMRIKPRVYRGSHVDHPLVHTLRGRTIGVSGPALTTYVDGERACPLPITVTAVPGALTLSHG